MKDELLRLISRFTGTNQKINHAREYLQAYILRSLFRNNFSQNTIFHGGTCLRFLYQTQRFSEDLDFAVLSKTEPFPFEALIQKLVKDLENSGYQVAVKIKMKILQSALIKFSGLLFEAGISHRPEENISIKIDLDTNPPDGANLQNQVINKYFMFGITAYDLPCLFSGKINAILTRNYIKGRDYYDLFWYLTTHKNLLPNFNFLNNSLLQFNPKFEKFDSDSWKSQLRKKVQEADWKTIQKDVSLLLEDPDDQMVFTPENLLNLLTP